jgi:hypothetical protein
MTLVPYSEAQLDQLALRLLDLAVTMRRMANACRDNTPPGFTLHDKKALEWLDRLDDWAHDSEMRLDTALLKQRAEQRAAKAPPAEAPSRSGRKK